ncbi:MAG: DegV family protein [Anaerolineaceae bacterium]|jgi:DegV family protein with EDD domain|nr:DegV family protein [Anaerolineae bacterium]MDX9829097.1 DegV family protein [Anaerolineae bacterium]NLF11836.1 DegV family protein [Anaerolineaceae bacterium]
MIKIVTDSTAYLPQSIVEKNDLRVVPLCVHFGDKTYREGVDLSNGEFYTRLKEAPVLPTTSQPSAGEFYEVFSELVAQGHEIVTLTISSRLSGTWNSAMAAKEMMPDAKISVIDSLSTSVGLMLMIEAAVNARNAGASREEIVQQVEEIKKKMHLFFVVDTLEYLAKGGRIGNAKAFLGTLLKVKPILFLKDGAIEPLEQVRSKRKAQARMVDLVAECMGGDGKGARIALVDALVPEESAVLAKEIHERLGCEPLYLTQLGPVIGTHTGPGVVGVAVYR